jgi:hypothetical protein
VLVRESGRWIVVGALLAGGWLMLAGDAFAQQVEFQVGHAGFADDAVIHHAVLGGALRWPLTPRLGAGPEAAYMIGPGADRDVLVTGNVWWDLVASGTRPRGVVPYVVGGAGLFRHSDRVGTGTFASAEGTFTAGGGARFRLSRRTYLSADARVGWELHTRLTAQLGIQLAR